MKRIARIRRQTSRARGERIVRAKKYCAIIPPKTKTRNTFDSFEHSVFETLFRLIAGRLNDSRIMAAAKSRTPGIRLRRDVVDHGVHSSLCALGHTVRDILSGNRRILRYMLRGANRPSVNTANTQPQREKY